MSPQPPYFLLSGPKPSLAVTSLDSQLGFTWESPSPAQVAAISECFIAQAGWPLAKHRSGLILACTTQETPEPAHAVDSYRPHQSTTTLPLHSRSSMKGRERVHGQQSQPVLADDWPGNIPPIDLPTTIKSQLQEEGVLIPHKGCTLSTQLG